MEQQPAAALAAVVVVQGERILGAEAALTWTPSSAHCSTLILSVFAVSPSPTRSVHLRFSVFSVVFVTVVVRCCRGVSWRQPASVLTVSCAACIPLQNVYGCLVCGKFYQGRGPHTQAYTHSVQAGHHLFINLANERVYCLPGEHRNTLPCHPIGIHVCSSLPSPCIVWASWRVCRHV